MRLYLKLLYLLFLSAISLFCHSAPSHAASETVKGMTGLIETPTARMWADGTYVVGSSAIEPYAHAFLGLQLGPDIALSFRQSARVTALGKDIEEFFPGVDGKFRILDETPHHPALSLGLDAMVGDRRFSGEYLVGSKNIGNFDVSLGLGWGRYGDAGHIKNPLGALGNHFRAERDRDSANSAGPDQWFTGPDIGFFGGVEYHTPIPNLSLKAEYNPDPYEIEARVQNFDKGSDFNFGASYTGFRGLRADLGVAGFDRVTLRLSTADLIGNRRGLEDDNLTLRDVSKSADPARYGLTDPVFNDGVLSAGYNQIGGLSTVYGLKQALYYLYRNAPEGTRLIRIGTSSYGIAGPSFDFTKADVEAILEGQKSAEELWQQTITTAEYGDNEIVNDGGATPTAKPLGFINAIIYPALAPLPVKKKKIRKWATVPGFEWVVKNQMSLAENEVGLLYRSALLAQRTQYVGHGFSMAYGLRLNLKHNTDNLSKFNIPRNTPVRSDIADYSDGLRIDHASLHYARPLGTNLYAMVSAGLLEEMYGGYGASLNYRPFRSRVSLGVEGYSAYKRRSDGYIELDDEPVTTALLRAGYDLPESSITLNADAGRYLGGDYGVGIGIRKSFANGAVLEGRIAASNQKNASLLGGQTQFDQMLRVTVPLYAMKRHLTNDAYAVVEARPLGRDIAQPLETALPLDDVIRKVSFQHLMQNWIKMQH